MRSATKLLANGQRLGDGKPADDGMCRTRTLLPLEKKGRPSMNWGKTDLTTIHRAIDKEFAEFFVEDLFPELLPDEYIEVRALRDGKAQQVWFQSAADIRRFVRTFAAEWDIYFGVAIRRGKNGDAAHTSRITAVWADVDAKCFTGGKPEAREALNLIPLRPSYVVDSGNGYHAYWLLNTPLDAAKHGDRAKAAMQGIRGWLSDHAAQPLDAVHDLARILRVPNTLNHKDGAELRVQVDVLSAEPDRRYTLDDFRQQGLWADDHPVKRDVKRAPADEQRGIATTDDEVIARAMGAKNGEKFSKLFQRGDTDGYKSGSEADEALCTLIAFYTVDAEQIDRLFRRSALMRPKWDEPHGVEGVTYGQMTTAQALAYASTRPDGKATRLSCRFRSLDRLFEETSASTVWLAKPYVAEGAITGFVGKPKSGKTTFVMNLVARVVNGKTFLEHQTTRTPVVYLTEERGVTFRQVVRRSGLDGSEQVSFLYWHDTHGISWPDVVDAAIQECKRIEAKLLVVDTLGQFAGLKGDSEYQPGHAREAMRPLQQAASSGLAVLVGHHERKSGGDIVDAMLGSAAFGGAEDLIVGVRRGSQHTRRELVAVGRFDDTPERIEVELRGGEYVVLGTEKNWAERAARDALLALPAVESEAMTLKDIKPDKVSMSAMKRAASALTQDGKLAFVGRGVKGDPQRFYRTE